MPTYALSDEYIASFVSAAANDPTTASQMLVDLLEKPHETRGHFVDVLLDRLLDKGIESFSGDEIKGFLVVFTDVMDGLGRETKSLGDFGEIGIWRKTVAAGYFVLLVATRKAKRGSWLCTPGIGFR